MLTTNQTALQLKARTLAQQEFAPMAAEIDATEAYPWQNIKKLNAAGFMGMTIPKAYGGQRGEYGRINGDSPLCIKDPRGH